MGIWEDDLHTLYADRTVMRHIVDDHFTFFHPQQVLLNTHHVFTICLVLTEGALHFICLICSMCRRCFAVHAAFAPHSLDIFAGVSRSFSCIIADCNKAKRL